MEKYDSEMITKYQRTRKSFINDIKKMEEKLHIVPIHRYTDEDLVNMTDEQLWITEGMLHDLAREENSLH